MVVVEAMCILQAFDTHGAMRMRTNIDIDDELMKEAMRLTGHKTKKATVEAALRRVVQLERQKSILELRGTIPWEGNLDEMREGRFPDWGEDR